MKSTVTFLIFSLSVLIASISAFDVCHSFNYGAERRSALKIRNLESELTRYKSLLQNPSCNACNIDGVTPCYNNGTCQTTGPYSTKCICPDNTSGDQCETILSCDPPHLCGTDAICTVANHKINCDCPYGYTGNANVSCNLQTRQACLVTDPHFRTFDGASFDYMGTCPYYVMKACNDSVDFSITATSYFRNTDEETAHVTYTREMVFHTQGHEFKIDQNLNFWIDGILKPLNYYWPFPNATKISITKSGESTIQIDDAVTQASITFTIVRTDNTGHNLCVTVPSTSFFYGPDKMCGLLGSFDDHCDNDIRYSNGTVHPMLLSQNCTYGHDLNIMAVQDTWVINSTVDSCIEGAVLANNTGCDLTSAQAKCDLIRQAIAGTGAMAECQPLGHDILDTMYHDCTFDMCQGKAICDILDLFAKYCVQNVPFANIDTWRTVSVCPWTSTCQPNSHFSMRMSTCQPSCADVHYNTSSICHEAYTEGCMCDLNFYYDPNGQNHGYSSVCLPIEDCGCIDDDGQYRPSGTSWLSDDCSVSYQCFQGNLTSQVTSCSVNGKCTIVDSKTTCQCNSGYTGNGTSCADINECLDPAVCNTGSSQGVCTNLPGTYNCTCFAPYIGNECANYKPSRHCADLKLFHGVTQSGAYNVSIGVNYNQFLLNSQLNWTTVYCDMESSLGGWTLMSHGNMTSNKTFVEYVAGFGNPSNQNIWLGLDNIHAISQTPTSLRIVVESCHPDAMPSEDCTYDHFSITDSTEQYSIFLNSTCQGSSQEGWVTWDTTQLGPKFSTFDNDDSNGCSNDWFFGTGWWFHYVSRPFACGIANLNGLRFVCDSSTEAQYALTHLTWNKNAFKDAHMWLRPLGYPNYDTKYVQPTQAVASTPPADTVTTT
jgi:hypothetical protein